ncbi:hypothetical protein N802_01455 [Knoellia sinensis KCTC 19936]|uniref:histidine kinase n=1 Tax=Knoellia sinensis KCTC 19936 TaxID=1385520 RepID=A0A0A0JD25_9MICO|nr:ATP-binding protein [Knoellia sinensis]KGN35028.1 hypothetical protein N802_01455 [Knoellia sinensis KCTC 19936]
MTEPVKVEDARSTPEVPWYAIEEWSLRRKLALALAIPVLLAATFGGLRVVRATGDAIEFSNLESRVSVVQPAVRLIDSASAVAVASRSTDEEAVERARQGFDSATTELRSAMRESELTDEQITSLDQALAAGQPLRDSPPTAPAATVSDQFAEAARHITVVLNDLTSETSDARLTTIRDIIAGQVALTEQRVLTIGATPESPVDPITLGNAIGEEATAIAALESSLGADDTFVSTLAGGNELRLSSAPAVAAGTSALPRAQDAVSVYTTLANRINDQVVGTMAGKASDSRGTAIRDALLTLALLAAAVVLALAVARMLLEPIKQVRLGALEVAEERLPTALRQIREGQEPTPAQPLPVHTREEVGQLARAVDVLHAEALTLATEQARLRAQVSAMFETLSRRSTSLINQQLGLIERLESDEQDPRRLESLFRLDHLAARIRRNGESLLVLAGAAPRGVAGQDLALGDVLRAAISQVQDYQRVQLTVNDLIIQASAAPNLVHLFAELIDNALAYSPPDSTVTVSSVRGVDGGTLIEIVDSGLGMEQDAMDDANLSLATGGEVTPETARRMGLYVVGQLALRHEITVRIRANQESSGTVVSVFLPATLLATGRPTGPVGPSRDRSVAPADAPVASLEEGATSPTPQVGPGRPRVTTLTAVPNLPSDDDESTRSLTALKSNATPTALPSVSSLPVRRVPDTRPPAEGDAATPGDARPTPTGLPRRQPGVSVAGSPLAGPARPSWANSPSAEPSTGPIARTPIPPRPKLDADGQPTPPAAPTTAPESAAPESTTPATTIPEATATQTPSWQPDAVEADPVTSAQVSEDFDFVASLQPAPVSDSPIFRKMQSSWLSENEEGGDLPWSSDDIDRGWEAAERAQTGTSAGTSSAGLPMRRPGSTLVPGQAGSGSSGTVVRDPEAIRARLNRHRAGVQRGRRSTTDTTESRATPSGSVLLDEETDRS